MLFKKTQPKRNKRKRKKRVSPFHAKDKVIINSILIAIIALLTILYEDIPNYVGVSVILYFLMGNIFILFVDIIPDKVKLLFRRKYR